jgi:hypothetical protein
MGPGPTGVFASDHVGMVAVFDVEGDAQFFLANATWYFSLSRVQPYIKG